MEGSATHPANGQWVATFDASLGEGPEDGDDEQLEVAALALAEIRLKRRCCTPVGLWTGGKNHLGKGFDLPRVRDGSLGF